MRAGACTVQQALTPDAAAVVKQAVSLARRRGNPQVTPLHVASAMLLQQGAGSSSSSGLLLAACLRSHSLPPQCRALELYFNVALNRLPTSTSPLLGPAHVYSYPPSLSNALVAAFKRAQAHQRRGSADAQQQQPVLAVKIELEQLVISILDDPSVSRVMREAGFSCTEVKANVEQAVSSVEGDSLALSLNCVDDSAIRAKCGDRSRNGSSRCLSLREAAGSSGELTAVDSTFCDEFSAEKCEAVKRFPRSNIPHWLQHCRDHQEIPHSKKWSLTYGGSPSQRTTLNLSTVVSPSSSVSSYEKKQWRHYQNQPYQPWLLANVHDANHHAWKANSGKQVHIINDVDIKIVRAIKVKSNDSSASNGSVEEVQCRSRFKELSAESLKALCSALEKEVPWQADMVPEIASTVLRCRSGMTRRSRRDADASTPASAKEDTWLLFLGGDTEGKARVARELANLVFGSRKRFVSISAAASSPASSDSTGQRRQQGSKRPRPASCSLDRLYETVRDDPHRVLVLEDVERADRLCQLGIRESIERGGVRSHGGDEAALGDAIVILSCESFDARSRASPPPLMTKKAKLESEKEIKEEDTEDHHGKEAIAAPTSASSSFDLNMSVQNDDMEDSCFTDGGLVKAVDRAFFFRRLDETSD